MKTRRDILISYIKDNYIELFDVLSFIEINHNLDSYEEYSFHIRGLAKAYDYNDELDLNIHDDHKTFEELLIMIKNDDTPIYTQILINEI